MIELPDIKPINQLLLCMTLCGAGVFAYFYVRDNHHTVQQYVLRNKKIENDLKDLRFCGCTANDQLVQDLEKCHEENRMRMKLAWQWPSALKSHYQQSLSQFQDRLSGLIAFNDVMISSCVRDIRECRQLGLQDHSVTSFVKNQLSQLRNRQARLMKLVEKSRIPHQTSFKKYLRYACAHYQANVDHLKQQMQRQAMRKQPVDNLKITLARSLHLLHEAEFLRDF